VRVLRAIDISVLPVPHSPTMRTERAVLRVLARPEMVKALLGLPLSQVLA
jgi:hypothetical protein